MQTSRSSKPLGHDDESGFQFVSEMLQGDPTFAINFDRVQWDNAKGCYVIVEYLLCDEAQFSRGITPFTSHPNRYFHKNAQKFISLWQIARDLGAVLYLVNYARRGTEFENQVLVMKVEGVDPAAPQPVRTIEKQFTRQGFSRWFRALNRRGAR